MPEATTVPNTAPFNRNSWLRNPSVLHVLAVSGLLFLVVVVVNVIISFPYLQSAVALHGSAARVVVQGESVWYKLAFGGAKRIESAPGFAQAPVRVIEAVSYGQKDEYAVLATVPGGSGVVLGILRANNTFETVLADGTPKTDLAVRPDGEALFATTVEGGSRIMSFNLVKPTLAPVDRGLGNSPRLFADGFFVAITPAGLVRIDPNQKEAQPILPLSMRHGLAAALSPDATQFVVSNSSGKTLLYRVVSTSPATVNLEGTMSGILYSMVATFLDDGYVLEQTSNTTASLYKEHKGSIEKIGSLSLTK